MAAVISYPIPANELGPLDLLFKAFDIQWQTHGRCADVQKLGAELQTLQWHSRCSSSMNTVSKNTGQSYCRCNVDCVVAISSHSRSRSILYTVFGFFPSIIHFQIEYIWVYPLWILSDMADMTVKETSKLDNVHSVIYFHTNPFVCVDGFLPQAGTGSILRNLI